MILYSVIARAKDGAVLVESIVAGVEGNFPQVTVEVLERIVGSSSVPLPDGGRRTFVQQRDLPMFGGLFSGAVATQWTCFGLNNANDVESQARRGGGNGDIDYYFHLCRKDNVIILCISDDIDARQHAVNYDFLDDVESKFTKSYAPFRVTKAKAYEMDKKFNMELGKLIYFYNENRRKMVMNDRVGDLLVKVDDLKGLLGTNITVVLERDRHLSDLIEQSDNMVQGSKVFTKRSSMLKTKMQREYYLYYVVAFLFGALVLYLFFAEICGYTGQKCSSIAGSSGGNYTSGGGEN